MGLTCSKQLSEKQHAVVEVSRTSDQSTQTEEFSLWTIIRRTSSHVHELKGLESYEIRIELTKQELDRVFELDAITNRKNYLERRDIYQGFFPNDTISVTFSSAGDRDMGHHLEIWRDECTYRNITAADFFCLLHYHKSDLGDYRSIRLLPNENPKEINNLSKFVVKILENKPYSVWNPFRNAWEQFNLNFMKPNLLYRLPILTLLGNSPKGKEIITFLDSTRTARINYAVASHVASFLIPEAANASSFSFFVSHAERMRRELREAEKKSKPEPEVHSTANNNGTTATIGTQTDLSCSF